MIFLGWLLGVVVGLATGIALITALGLPIPGALAFLTTVFGFPPIPLAVAIVLLVLIYVLAYVIATTSVRPSLPAFTPPLATPIVPTGGAPVALPALPGELFARGLMIGTTAALNAVGLILFPALGGMLALWAFLVVSLAAIPPVALSLIYQGFLGWSAWLFPVSYVATAVGLLLFLINALFAFAGGGIAAFRIDFTTGVIETAGGLTGITGFAGGFSLGNFTFLTALASQSPFMAPGLSSHETGHSLNTAAFGGVMLWINAVDQNIPPFRKLTMAYGELTAESHAQAMPPPPTRVRFFVNLWG